MNELVQLLQNTNLSIVISKDGVNIVKTNFPCCKTTIDEEVYPFSSEKLLELIRKSK